VSTSDTQHMIDHCAKLLEANKTAYVDPDSLAMARFIIEQRTALIESNKAICAALDLFDAVWCPDHGHAPRPEHFARAEELSKLIGREHAWYAGLIDAANLRRRTR